MVGICRKVRRHTSKMVFPDVILLPILFTAFLQVKCGDATKCYKCNDCPNAEKLSDPEECTKVTLFDTMRTAVTKSSRPDGSTRRYAMGEIDVLDQGFKPESCFKLILTYKEEETVYRGCAPKSLKDRWETPVEGQNIRICVGESCNLAPTTFASSIFVAMVSTFVALLNA